MGRAGVARMRSGYRVGAVQASGPASEAGVASYYIRQGTFAPQGPFEEARVAGYIAQGKLRAGMEISADGERWMPVEEHRLFAAAAPPVQAVATPPPVRAVQPVEDVEVVEEISAARPERRPARRPRPAPASGGGGKAVVAVVGLLIVGAIAVMASKGGGEASSEGRMAPEVLPAPSAAPTQLSQSRPEPSKVVPDEPAWAAPGVPMSLTLQVETYERQIAIYEKAIKDLEIQLKHAPDANAIGRIVDAQMNAHAKQAFAQGHLDRAKKYLALGCKTELEAAAREEEEAKRSQAEREARWRAEAEQRDAARAAEEKAEREARAARDRQEAEAEARRAAERAAAEEKRRADIVAAVPGTYRALGESLANLSNLSADPQRDIVFEVALRAGGAAEAVLQVKGRVRGQSSGTWEVDFERTDRIMAIALRFDWKATSQMDGVPASGACEAQIDDGSAPTLVGPFFGQGRTTCYFRRVGDAAAPGDAAKPLTAADLVGEYEPTPETLGDRKVTFRIVLSKDSTFTTTFKGESGSARVYKGSWKFDGEKVIMTATTLNGTRLREQQVEEIPLDGDELVAGEYWMRKVKK